MGSYPTAWVRFHQVLFPTGRFQPAAGVDFPGLPQSLSENSKGSCFQFSERLIAETIRQIRC